MTSLTIFYGASGSKFSVTFHFENGESARRALIHVADACNVQRLVMTGPLGTVLVDHIVKARA